MKMVDRWHRRWLREELGRARDEDGHVALAQVMMLDGWSGWVTAPAVDQGRLSAAVGRGLHRRHVRWLMGHLDAMVASGQYGYYEEGDAIGCVDTGPEACFSRAENHHPARESTTTRASSRSVSACPGRRFPMSNV